MRLAIKLASALKSAADFTIHRPKDAVIILLIFIIALTGWKLNREKNRVQELAAKIEGLPPDTKRVVTIYRDRIVTKWRTGPVKIEYRDRYLPPEGHIDVITKTDRPGELPEVVIKDRGFTRRIGGGFVYSDRFLPAVDLKWAFLRRYSSIIGITPSFSGLGISRHLDDVTPFQNLEILGIGGFAWDGNIRFGIGMRTNF
ncbi:MAG: hypothetical protein HYT79_02600 [Elusimicrobia bacterium]|nr:hypothetical protein [Elusimicrobiota bacterium]